jgi:hypothetical protein
MAQPFTLLISQSTKWEESRQGFDLGLRLMTPDGVKYALIQSKVYDPYDDQLRCYTTEAWNKLRDQLRRMRGAAAEMGTNLVFLAVYLPAEKLYRQADRFGTYEQGVEQIPASNPNSSLPDQFGVSLIRDDDLLDASGDWLQLRPPDHVRFTGNSLFPIPRTLSWVLLDMMLCQIGGMSDRAAYADDWEDKPQARYSGDINFAFPVRRQIDVQYPLQSNTPWRQFQFELGRIIR